MTATNKQIVAAYRHLFRAALQAVHYSSPARHQVRDILRSSFRDSPSSQLVGRKIDNTIRFLEYARDFRGTEHKILRGILFTRYWRDARLRNRHGPGYKDNTDVGLQLRSNSASQYDATLAMLNESLDVCLRV